MPEPKIQHLSQEEAVQQIVETVQHSEAGSAPFALVLGSGFSQGLVPTARELVESSLPLWMESLRSNRSFAELTSLPDAERKALAQSFWKRFISRNAKRDITLQLNSDGLPEDYPAAYKAAFDSRLIGGVGEPAQARKFQRALMRLDQPRLNAAHFLLASLLGVQPGLHRRNDSFLARAAFSRLILTTNFDPFLQIALQAVNRLYFMSDTPELGVGDEILDNQADAIHLVYLHGSIHRRAQAASETDIHALKQKNARTLAPVLKRHGVIVLGYSGWDDAIVESLAACDRFDHRLYWCGREADPLAKGAFGPRVPDILRKPTAVYIPISGAGHFVAQLYTQLVQGLPRLLDNPIGQIREMLGTIDLKELRRITPPDLAGTLSPEPHSSVEAFLGAQNAAINRLARAEQVFLSPAHAPSAAAVPVGLDPTVQRDSDPLPDSGVAYLLSSAQVALALGNPGESLRFYAQALEMDALDSGERAQVLVGRGASFYFSGATDRALADWTTVIEQLPDAPVEHVARALCNRGVTWSRKGEADRAMSDYTRIIELPGAPVEQVAQAFGGRGWLHYQSGNYAAFLSDTEAALSRGPTLPFAAFNLGLALLACNRNREALSAYEQAADQFPTDIERLGLKDLSEAQKVWLTHERAAPVIELLKLRQPPKSSSASA